MKSSKDLSDLDQDDADELTTRDGDSLVGRRRLSPEKKLGLAVVGGLLLIFGTVLYFKLRNADDPNADKLADVPAATNPDDANAKLFNAAKEPTVVAAKKPLGTLPARTADDPYKAVPAARPPLDPNARQPVAAPNAASDPYGDDLYGSPPSTRPSSPAASRPPVPNPSRGPAIVSDSSAAFDPYGDDYGSPPSAKAASVPNRLAPAEPARPAATGATSGSSYDRYDVAGRQNPLRDSGASPSAASTAGSRPTTIGQRPNTLDTATDSYDAARTQPPERFASTTTPLRTSDGVARRADGRYVVQPNDTYSLISQKAYGTDGYFKALYEHNVRINPQYAQLEVGDPLDVPATDFLQKNYPELCPKPRATTPAPKMATVSTRAQAGQRVYTVVEGDTLFDIARYELGKASRWAEIYDINRDHLSDDFDYIKPGTQLLLPSESRSGGDTLTRRPGDPLRR